MFYHPKLVAPLALVVTILLTWALALRGPQVLLALVFAYAVVDCAALPAMERVLDWAIENIGGESAN